MKILELSIKLPQHIAREADAAGLLSSEALSQLIQDELTRRAARQLLAGAKQATDSGSRPLPMKAVQAEVKKTRAALRAIRNRS